MDKGLVVLGLDVGEDVKTVKKFKNRMKISFPLLIDQSKKVSGMYGVRSFPNHFLIDRDGKVIGYAPGYKDWNEQVNKDYIERLLKRPRKK